MKIKETLLYTVLPIAITAGLPIGYLHIKDKVFPEPELIGCTGCQLSTLVYLWFFGVIVIICSLYQLILGRWILKGNENSTWLNGVNSVVFALFFTIMLVALNLYQGTTEWDFFPLIFVALLLFGLLFSVVSLGCRKLLGRFY